MHLPVDIVCPGANLGTITSLEMLRGFGHRCTTGVLEVNPLSANKFLTFSNIFQHFQTLCNISSHSLKCSNIWADIRSHFRFNIGWTYLSTFVDISSKSPTFYYINFPTFGGFNIWQHSITFDGLILHIPWHFRPTFYDISALQFPTFVNIFVTVFNISLPLIHIL